MASGELGVVETDKEEVVPFGTAIVESSEDTYGKTALHLDASAILIPSNLTNFICGRLNLTVSAPCLVPMPAKSGQIYYVVYDMHPLCTLHWFIEI